MACMGERTREERNAELLQNAIVIDETPVRSGVAPQVEGNPATAARTPDDEEVQCTGEKSWEERDAELRGEAVSLDERPARFRRGSRWSEPAFLWSVVQTLTMRRLLLIGLAALAGCVQAQSPVAGRPGQPLIGKTHLHDIYSKTGRSGRMIFVVARLAFFDKAGIHLANSDSRIVMREKSA